MKPKPKSVVLDLLSTLGGRSAPVRFLVASADLFDIDSNATRVAITRLLACGLVERDERGAYRAGSVAAPILSLLYKWRSLEKRTLDWGGVWIGATPAAGCYSKDDRADSRKSFEFTGMREFSPGLFIRPDNLDGGLDAIRSALVGLGVPTDTPVFRICDFDASNDIHARALWDAAVIQEQYRTLAGQLKSSAARLPTYTPKQAMAESFLLGGKAIRRIVLDPLLPEAIVPIAEREELIRVAIAYEEIGQRYWAPFFERHGLLINSSPVDRQILCSAESTFIEDAV